MTKLTDLMVRNLTPDGTRREIFEGNGFGLRVSAKGIKSFIFVYHYGGKSRRLTLGQYPSMGLSDAREAFKAAHEARREGRDPAAEKRQRQAQVYTPVVADPEAMTFRQLADLYIEKYARRNKSTWAEDERSIKKDVLPAWGELPAGSIRKADVRNLIEAVANRAPVGANRLLTRLGTLFRWAVEMDYLEASPCLYVRPPTREVSRDRILNDDELRAVWHALPAIPASDQTRLAIQLAVTTGQRIGEITAATWAEFDGPWWTVPREHAKNREAHRVALSPLALDLFTKARKAAGGSEYCLPGRSNFNGALTGGPITHHVVGHALRRSREAAKSVKVPRGTGQDKRRALEALQSWTKIPRWTAHDLRRTAASNLGALGIPRETIAAVLGHRDGRMMAIYDRYGRDDEKIDAMNRWADRLLAIVEEEAK